MPLPFVCRFTGHILGFLVSIYFISFVLSSTLINECVCLFNVVLHVRSAVTLTFAYNENNGHECFARPKTYFIRRHHGYSNFFFDFFVLGKTSICFCHN